MLSENSQVCEGAFRFSPLFACDNSIFFYWVTKNYINYSNSDPNDDSCIFPESVKIRAETTTKDTKPARSRYENVRSTHEYSALFLIG